MVETIVITIVKTLTTLLFKHYINTTTNQYYQQADNMICSSSYRDGDYSEIEPLKIDIEQLLYKRVKEINEIAIEENLGNIIKSDEMQIVEKFRHDGQLSRFVHQNIQFKSIEYRDEVDRVFGKGCILKTQFLTYSKKRLQQIAREISLYHEHQAFDELENEIYQGDNRYFQELDRGF